MKCEIYGTEETDYPDRICDECKFSTINNHLISFVF